MFILQFINEYKFSLKAELANSVDPDQTAPKEQSDLGLHCLLIQFCSNIYNYYISVYFQSLSKRNGF